MFVVSALVIARNPPRLNDGSVLIGEDIITVDLSPFVAFGWLPQVVGAIINLVAALPVVMLNPRASLPFTVRPIGAIIVSIARLRLVMMILIGVILRNGRKAGKTEGQNGYSQNPIDFMHSDSCRFDSLGRRAVVLWARRFLVETSGCVRRQRGGRFQALRAYWR